MDVQVTLQCPTTFFSSCAPSALVVCENPKTIGSRSWQPPVRMARLVRLGKPASLLMCVMYGVLSFLLGGLPFVLPFPIRYVTKMRHGAVPFACLPHALFSPTLRWMLLFVS